MNAELAPILTQIDFLTQQVENVQTLPLPPGVENQNIFTDGSASDMGAPEDQGGYAPVKGKKTRKLRKPSAAGIIHAAKMLKKDGA